MKSKYYIGILFFTPLIAGAFSLAESTFRGTILEILSVIGILIPILFALAFIVFFWGISKFILNSGSKDGIEKGKSYMFWGILALFVLISFRAIIAFISNDLELGDPTIPLLHTSSDTTVIGEGNVLCPSPERPVC